MLCAVKCIGRRSSGVQILKLKHCYADPLAEEEERSQELQGLVCPDIVLMAPLPTRTWDRQYTVHFAGMVQHYHDCIISIGQRLVTVM